MLKQCCRTQNRLRLDSRDKGLALSIWDGMLIVRYFAENLWCFCADIWNKLLCCIEDCISYEWCTNSASANPAFPWYSHFWTVLSRYFCPSPIPLYGQHGQVLYSCIVILMYVVWAYEGQTFFTMSTVLLNCNEFQQMDVDSSAPQMMSQVRSSMLPFAH